VFWYLGGTVKFLDIGDVETDLEFIPDFRSHAVPTRYLNLVFLIIFPLGCRKEVSTQFPDVKDLCSSRFVARFPVRSSGEFPTENETPSISSRHGETGEETGSVEEGHAGQSSRTGSPHMVSRRTNEGKESLQDGARFGVSCGSRSVDQVADIEGANFGWLKVGT
jgi:hypothetical protein